jgi:hypothetical protein
VPENYFEDFSKNINYLLLIEKNTETFQVPENYFAEVEKSVIEKISLPKTSTFEAPEFYFENLPQRIQHRLYEEQKAKQKISFQLKPIYALAAAVLVIALVASMYLFIDKKDSAPHFALKPKVETKQVCLVKDEQEIKVKVSEETKKEIEKHIDEQMIESMDESLIMEEIAMNHSENESERAKPTNNAEIRDYLLDNNIDETLIEEAVN